MLPDDDLDLDAPLPSWTDDLVVDLQAEPLFEAMAGGDDLLYAVARQVLLRPLDDVALIEYRQQILRDCSRVPEVVRALYELAGDALDVRRRVFGGFMRDNPRVVLHHAIDVLADLLPYLRRLRRIADEAMDRLGDSGLRTLFAAIVTDLDENYCQQVEAEIARLQLPGGVVIGKRLGLGNAGVGDVLHRPERQHLADRLGFGDTRSFSFQVAARDQAGVDALSDLESRGVNRVADAAGQAADHLVGLFRKLRVELGFYLGCAQLQTALETAGVAVTRPEPLRTDGSRLTAHGLYDPCLVLGGAGGAAARPVGNDLNADDRTTVVITGANSGGKSTFLRAVGLGVLMSQCGLFVCAEDWTWTLRSGLFTHFLREEDATLTSGRFDDELRRMKDIVDAVTPGGLVLMNESFASTNESEAAEIGAEVVQGLTRAGVGVVVVTHLYALADRLQHSRDEPLFLRAERRGDGVRTYRLVEAEPLPTSFGADLYARLSPWPEPQR
ncbi:hypothetical protein FHX74_000510 [Friedmanniella endophytica]|uniref:DNA mismatch repair proteins mutS family domain-containing protein n=2 Tax=Microlunatus kandeliicorticis TaxID=1759536 RepID=A0A7W3P4H4_9ACTN|nr:hypothetical protein [Microlunatus kandeliicorticis]